MTPRTKNAVIYTHNHESGMTKLGCTLTSDKYFTFYISLAENENQIAKMDSVSESCCVGYGCYKKSCYRNDYGPCARRPSLWREVMG